MSVTGIRDRPGPGGAAVAVAEPEAAAVTVPVAHSGDIQGTLFFLGPAEHVNVRTGGRNGDA